MAAAPYILISITIILNIILYRITRIAYRDEDLGRILDGSLKVKSETMYFPQASWVTAAIMLVVALIAHEDLGTDVIMMGLLCFVTFVFTFVAAFHRNSYYAYDDERLLFVKHGILQWSHTWDEIDHARKRIISTGKSYVVHYDIETRDGVKHRHLPAVLGKELKARVYMDNKVNVWAVCTFVIIILAAGVLIALVSSAQ